MKITKPEDLVLPTWKPRDYQAPGIKNITDNPHCGLLWPPGLGKTGTVLESYIMLKARGEVQHMYVVAPPTVCILVWMLQYKEFENFKHLTSAYISGPKKLKAMESDVDIYAVSPDGVKILFENPELIKPNSMVVFDESTKFKKTSTLRFKTVRKLLKYFDRRYILTGSFTTNGIMDLFGQVYLLDKGDALGEYITQFRNEYFTPSGYGGYTYDLAPGAEARILDAIRPIVMRLKASDHIKLPPLIRKTIYVTLPPKARKHYNEMESIMITALDGKAAIAGGAAQVSSKCRQIANGGLYSQEKVLTGEVDEEGIPTYNIIKHQHHVHDEKTKAVVSLIEELSGEPALVVYDTKHDFHRLQKGLGNPPYIGNGTTQSQLESIEQDWNNGYLPVLMVHPESCSHGLNLQRGGRAIIWHSLTFNLEYFEQLYQRVYRSGQEHTVYMYFILAKDTIDDYVLDVLNNKDEDQQRILAQLQHKFKKEK